MLRAENGRMHCLAYGDGGEASHNGQQKSSKSNEDLGGMGFQRQLWWANHDQALAMAVLNHLLVHIRRHLLFFEFSVAQLCVIIVAGKRGHLLLEGWVLQNGL